jgi:deoxyribodipyrimidine photolyase-related protein
LMTTKPYISGAAYINRMSDYCSLCAFDPASNCPITPLYWAFLQRHRRVLQASPRLRMTYSSLHNRRPDQKSRDRMLYETVRDILARGERIMPGEIEKV